MLSQFNTEQMACKASDAVFKKITATNREWGLFGVRWVFPLGVLFYVLFTPGIQEEQILTTLILIMLMVALSNLVVALLQIYGYWAGFVAVIIIGIDAVLAVLTSSVTGGNLLWLGLLPISMAGLYFGWLPGVILGAVMALVSIVVQLGSGDFAPDATELVLLFVGYPSAGGLSALLAQGAQAATPAPGMLARLRVEKMAEQASPKAEEYVDIIYDMVEVLSASKLDPSRVLDAAVTFGLEGLQRAGVAPPLFSAALLFAEGDNGASTVLRVARASSTFRPEDHEVAVSGTSGAISQSLESREPIVLDSPKLDPEVGRFLSFAACNTVMCLPIIAGTDSQYGVLLVGSTARHVFDAMHLDLMRAIANQASASLHNAKLYFALREQRDRIVGVEQAARAQLAANLHDGPTQSVSAITMRLNYVRRVMEKDQAEAMKELYQIEDLAMRTAKEIRAMLFILRPKSLEKGLSAGLKQLAVQTQETFGQKVEVKAAIEVDAMLDTQTVQTLFSIATEAVNNARKHANASIIQIYLVTQQGMVVLGISDDGTGFDVGKALAESKEREGHLGLVNLKERAALVDGVLHIDSAPGKGTRMIITIPIEVLRLKKAEEAERLEDRSSA